MSVQSYLDCGCAPLRGGGVSRCPNHTRDIEEATANELLEKDLHRQRERERERRVAELTI